MGIPKQVMSKQIRLKCLDCCADNTDYIKFCGIYDCPLWYFRFGTYPGTYIKNQGKYSKILFDIESFKSGGLFDPEKELTECRKSYQQTFSTTEHTR